MGWDWVYCLRVNDYIKSGSKLSKDGWNDEWKVAIRLSSWHHATSLNQQNPHTPIYTINLHTFMRLESITLVSSDAVDFVMAPTLRRDFATCWDAADVLIHGLVFWNAETQRFKFQGHSRQPQHARLGHGHQQGKGGEVVIIPASTCAVWIGNYLWCFNQTRARWQRNYLDQEYHHLCTRADAQKLCMYISIMYLYR